MLNDNFDTYFDSESLKGVLTDLLLSFFHVIEKNIYYAYTNDFLFMSDQAQAVQKNL